MEPYFELSNPYNKLYNKIGEAIKAIYPIGTSREDASYHNYAGIKKLMGILEHKNSNEQGFNQPWLHFLDTLQKGSTGKIQNATFGYQTAFTAWLILEEYQDASLRRVKKLVFSVSHVAPFFTVYGVDETFILEKDDELGSSYYAINVITESPYKEFAASFHDVESAIVQQFTGYSFVPVRICLRKVKGLQTPDSFADECKVHNALFSGSFDVVTNNFFRGEAFYGSGPSIVTVTLQPPPPIG